MSGSSGGKMVISCARKGSGQTNGLAQLSQIPHIFNSNI